MEKMEKIILYFLKKYHGNWDMVYDAISNKEAVDWSEVNQIEDSFDYQYMPIISENYPDKLKSIYMPPFSLFYTGNIKYLNENVLTIVGKLNKRNTNQLLKVMQDNVVLCVKNEDLTDYLMQMILEHNLRIIVLCNGSFQQFKYEKTNNILLISEYNDLNFDSSTDQTIERLLYAFGDKIFINGTSWKELENLVFNYENISKSFYTLTTNKYNPCINNDLMKNKDLSYINSINEINFIFKN